MLHFPSIRSTSHIALFTILLSASALFNLETAHAECPNSSFDHEIINSHESERPMFMKWYWLEEGNQYYWEVENMTQGTNAVMRLFASRYGHGYRSDYMPVNDELRRDHDSGDEAGAPKINRFEAPYTGFYLIVVHSLTSRYQGLGDLWFNGEPSAGDIQIGGQMAYSCTLRQGDRMHSMHESLPEGTGHHQLLVTETPTGPGLFAGADRSKDGGRGVDYTHSGPDVPNEFTNTYVASGQPFSGTVSQAWNDARDDEDGDGLGPLLEERVGTCPNSDAGTVTEDGWDCSTYDSRDTDNDGISDYEELFGIHDELCTSSGGLITCTHKSVPFRLWGADPTHKDAFIHVDYGPNFKYDCECDQGEPGCSCQEDDDDCDEGEFEEFEDCKVRPHALADYFTNEKPMKEVYEAFNAGTPKELDNPNGEQGLRLHFDVEDAELVDFDGDSPAFIFDGGGSRYIETFEDDDGEVIEGCTRQHSARTYMLSEKRKKHFRYMCARSTGSGNASRPDRAAFRANVRSGSASYYIAHEFGHVLGLGHGGVDDFNGKPNYHSHMNYAFSGSGVFSQEIMPPLNPTDLCEEEGLGAGVDPSHLIGSIHEYDIDENGAVDWNRDDNVSSCQNPVRAPITWAPVMHTGLSSLGRAQVIHETDKQTSDGAIGQPALARLTAGSEERLFLFYSDGDQVVYRHTDFPDGCPQNNADLAEDRCGEDDGGKDNWGKRQGGFYAAKTLATEVFEIDGIDHIVAAIRTPNDQLRIVRYRRQSPDSWILSANDLTGEFGNIRGTPSIAKRGDELVVVWQHSTPRIMQLTIDNQGVVSNFEAIHDASGTLWQTYTSPALAKNRQSGTLYLLRTTGGSNLEILSNSSGTTWSKSSIYDIPTGSQYETKDQPGFAWSPYDRVNDPKGPGHWWIAYPSTNPNRNRRVHALRLDEDKALVGQFHHRWTYAKEGTSLAFLDHPQDSNLRAANIRPTSSDGEDRVVFFPFADGQWNYELEGTNDFEIMSHWTCEGINNGDRPCGPLDGSTGLPNAYVFPGEENDEDGPDCDL